MIGKHIQNSKGHSSFEFLNDYITGKTSKGSEEKIALTDCLNLISVETATIEMEALAFQNNRCVDPVMHLLLSWKENEKPTPIQAKEAVEITLTEMNLSECQAVYALHQNTNNMHLHICVNRIDPGTTRAIDPAHGWTRRGMERAARRIEHTQGWQTENNTWSEINEQGEIVRKPRSSENTIPQKAQDMENLTGEQSAIRKAQNALKGKLKELSTWEDFHDQLSFEGMKYQKKGSGAVIMIDDVTVKASDVSRNLVLSKLEKQWGPYRESLNLGQVAYDGRSKTHGPQPLDDVNRNDKNWNAYIQARREQAKENKKRRQRLCMTQQKERKEQKERQKVERQAFLKSFGKGKTRQEINRQRSILATKHAYERAVQKGKQKEERESSQLQSAALISYDQWLRNKSLFQEAERWRHRKNKRILLLENPNGEIGNTSIDTGLMGYSMTVTQQGVKFTSQDKPRFAAFIDAGCVIKVYDEGERSVLAALQLAQSKWGGVQINGTNEYKQFCMSIAAKNGINIVNPEFQDHKKKIEPKPKDQEEAKFTTSTKKISERDKRIQQIAERVLKEQEKLRAEYETAYVDFNKLRETEPRGIGELFGESKKHKDWSEKLNLAKLNALRLWKACGGDMAAPDKGVSEVQRHLTPEYAQVTAERIVADDEWKKELEEDRARKEKEKHAKLDERIGSPTLSKLPPIFQEGTAGHAEPTTEEFSPRIGDRVAFHVESKNTDKKISLVGVIVSMDDVNGTVTMRVGQNQYTVNRNKGYFAPAEAAVSKPSPNRHAQDRDRDSDLGR